MNGAMFRRSPTCTGTINSFLIIIQYHDGIIYNHSQRHHQGCKRHTIYFVAEAKEKPKRNENGYWNSRSRNQCHLERLQQNNHNNNRQYSNQDFSQKVINTFANNFRLVRNAEHLDFFRQAAFKFRKHLFYFLAHFHDVVAFFHFDAKHHALVAVHFDVGCTIRIFAFHTGNIFQPHHTSIRCAKDNCFADTF